MSPAKSATSSTKRTSRRTKTAKATPEPDDALILDDGPGWRRALYMIVFAFIGYWVLWLAFVLAVAQAVLSNFSDGPNLHLLNFVRKLNAYMGEIMALLGFTSNKVPFPFSPFPNPPTD